MLALTIPLLATSGFMVPAVARVTAAQVRVHQALRMNEESTILDKLQTSYRIFQESKAAGADFKQAVADVIAGEYDVEAVSSEVKTLAESAPVVLFTWESSPACKKALSYLVRLLPTRMHHLTLMLMPTPHCVQEFTGVEPKIVRLDDPWSEGNPRRSALGRMTGKSSVPSIWIGGKYIGGCEDGPSDDAPGLVPLAFKGQLQTKLKSAGALMQS